MSDIELTRSQKLAVEASGKNILVSAGAGTGKTRVLVERFLNFVTSGQALVTEILALTFTEKAANEMKSRILLRLKELGMENARRDLELASISTFHSFASRILKEHPIEAGVDPDFTVIEAEEADLLKDQSLDEVIESGCREPGAGRGESRPVFELLKVYGERTIRQGLLKVLAAARNEGIELSEFFARSRQAREIDSAKDWTFVAEFFQELGEEELAADWLRFVKNKEWDWKRVEEFKEWMSPFSRRGGKKAKAEWTRIVQLAREFLGLWFERFADAWREKFEALALQFESVYERRKADAGLLDFDDLQIRTLELFKKKKPTNQKLLNQYRQLFKFILVDEFQDTNLLQLELVETLSSGNNLFFVGDYKQSIYSFRGAVPEHFLAMEKIYRAGEKGVCIPLLENFRAAPPILDFINSFFKNLWAEDDFQFEELLACTKEEGGVEVLVTKLDKEEGKLAHARMREADAIAGRIEELHESGVAYGDMAVLFQAMTSSGIYEQALKNAGIPYFVVAGRGFYHQPEIRDMMSFLACLENPLSDIALAATLRSPFFQITDDTLFWLARYAKQADDMNPLYGALKHFEVISEITELEKEKLRFFKSVTEELLAQKDRLRLAELLDRILEKTSFELAVLASPQGTRRFANLRKLADLAREYEAREMMPLGDFIRTVRGLETREIRESEAQVEAEKSGRVVRLMTIHQAKGLEFPVVFAADLAHKKHHSDGKTFLAESGLGYDFQVRNAETLELEEPLGWTRIKENNERKEKAEWKRLLYVAMTRARSRLILSGVHEETKTAATKESFNAMSSWMDWLMSSGEESPIPVQYETVEESGSPGAKRLAPAEKKIFQEILADFTPKLPEELFPSKTERERILERSNRILARLTPKEKTLSRVIDLPVSAYAAYRKDPRHWRRVYEIGYPDQADYEGDKEIAENEEETSAADFGTAMHRMLERLDFENPGAFLERGLQDFFRSMEKEKIAEARGLLEKFLSSSIFNRLRKAKKVYREIPFVLNERHGLIHGVLDLLFQEEDGRWHILDYKTAVGDARKVKQAGYDVQIQIYALAVNELLGITPASGLLYFLKNQWEYQLNFDPRVLADTGESFRALQEEVLAFSHEAQSSVDTQGFQ